jgi:hypothetical protein
LLKNCCVMFAFAQWMMRTRSRIAVFMMLVACSTVQYDYVAADRGSIEV